MQKTHSFGYKIMDFLFQALAVKQYLIFTGSFFVLTGLVMFILNAQLMPIGCTGTYGLEFAFTKTGFLDITNSICGADGARAIQIMLWVDTLLAVSYIGFLGNLLGSLVRHIEYDRALLIFSVPIFAGIINLIENTLLLLVLSNGDMLNSAVTILISITAIIKYILLIASLVLIIYYLYRLTVKSSPA